MGQKDKQQLKIKNKIHEQERDVSKLFQKSNVRIALIGFENQTDVDKDMIFRVIGYDGVSYKSQLLHDKRERYPIVTLVLYFGLTRWDKATTLYQALNISDEWKPYVNDYKLNLFEIAYLTDEQLAMFKSDFRIVADYFVQKRKNNNYIPSNETVKHVDAVLKLMSALTGDNRFEETQNTKKGGARIMCETFDEYWERGMTEGLTKGRAEGQNEMKRAMKLIATGCNTVEELVANGISIETAQIALED